MKHLLKVLSLRGVIIGGVATGLCFIFPPAAIAIATTAGVTYLASAAVSIKHTKEIEDEKAIISAGDLEFYEFKKVGNSFENKIINTIDRKVEQLKERKQMKKENAEREIEDNIIEEPYIEDYEETMEGKYSKFTEEDYSKRGYEKSLMN